MKYSFIIPTYNRAYILQNAINSILQQIGTHEFEILICDDGSKDNTQELIASVKNPKIQYLYQENRGPAVARNMGLENSKGTWIVYLDSDNTLMPEYLNTIEKYLAQNPGMLYAIPRQRRIIEIYDGANLTETKDYSLESQTQTSMLDFYQRRSNSDTNGFIHHRKFIDQGCRWDKNIAGPEDWEFFMQLAEKAPSGFVFIQDTITQYVRRLGKESDSIISNQTYEKWSHSYEYIYQKHKNSTLMLGQTWYPPKKEDFDSYKLF